MSGGHGGSRSWTAQSKAKLRRAEDVQKALNLRRRGFSLRDISRILDIALATAHKLVDDGLKAIPELERKELTALIHEQHDGIIKAHWGTRREPDSARVIQTSLRDLVAIFGLEAPKRTELTGADGGPLLTTAIDVTQLTDAQLEALARGDLAALASTSGDRASSPQGESDVEPE